MNYEHILSFALEHPWALTQGMRTIIADLLAHRATGGEADPTTIAAAVVNRKNLPQPRRGAGVAVIPMYGVIAPRMNMLSDMSGGTTFETLGRQLAEAVAHPDVSTIIFDVDSPGGNVAGASEFADEVRKARAVKPIVAQVQFLGASAAYWAIAGATTIVASKSSKVGAIGVYAIHDDISASLEQLGVKREVLSAGKFKAERIGGGPLSDDARAELQRDIDATYKTFIDDIANGRGVTAAAVRSGYAEGRCVSTAEALSLGMIDRVGTMADTLARYLSGPTAATAARALTAASTMADTSQEPSPATDQDRHSHEQWQAEMELALLDL